MDLIKEVYDLERFESVDSLQNWSNLPEDKFETISSNKFVKKIEGLGEQIGRSKGEIVQFFAGENFAHMDHPIVKALLEGNVVLSNDVRGGKPDIKQLADEGFSLEIERNGKNKFLSKGEVEEFIKALKQYTLPTLFFEKSPLLEVGEKFAI